MMVAFAACSTPADPVLGAAEAAQQRDKEAYLQYFTTRSQDLLELMWSGSDTHWEGLSVGAIQIVDTSPIAPSLKGGQRSVVVFTEHGKQFALVVHASGGEWLIDLVDSEGALTRLANGI